jgi:phage host-nuclease inhibitor protein Gam
MSYMGLEEYCQNINDVRSEWLIERFGDLERNAERVKATMAERVSEFRSRLDEQYDLLFEGMLRERRSGGEKYLNEPVNKIAR